MKVLLIYPPFADPRQPYLSIPALASYLRGCRIKVAALDANIEFYRHFLSPETIREGRRRAEERLLELNGKAKPGLGELMELCRMWQAVADDNKFRYEWDEIFSPAFPGGLARRLGAFYTALPLASAPHRPESIDAVTQFKLIRYRTPYSEYSSQDIIAGLQSGSPLDVFFRSLLPPVINREKPLAVGISLSFADQVLPAFRCARVVKDIAPEVHVVIGGPFVSCHMRTLEKTDLFQVIDSLVLDEGELPLERLVKELAGRQPDLSRVPSLTYRSGKRIFRNSLAPSADIMSKPVPDYDVFPRDRYLIPPEAGWLPFRLSRGCSWARCAFCQTRLPMVCEHQQPPADHLYGQIRTIMARTGARKLGFTDDAASPLILADLSRRFLREPLKLTWGANFRFEPALTLEHCLLFSRAGCRQVSLGIESLNGRLLRLIRKGTTVRMIKKVLSNLSWAGIDALAYMMVGLPTETEAEALDSFGKLKELIREGTAADYFYSLFRITPYSEIVESPERFGIKQFDCPADLDLNPPVYQFAGSGMPRSAAFALQVRFRRNLIDLPRELKIGEKVVPLRHRLEDMEKVLDKKRSISLKEWLNLPL